MERKQSQIRKDAQFVLMLADKGKVMLNKSERAYLDQSIKLYDMALETGDMQPKSARLYLRKALKKTLDYRINEG